MPEMQASISLTGVWLELMQPFASARFLSYIHSSF